MAWCAVNEFWERRCGLCERLRDRQDRCRRVNEFLEVVGGCGRGFFKSKIQARLEVDDRGRVWFVDDWTERRIFTHRPGKWRGFHGGGTLKNLVEGLRDFVMRDEKLRTGALGPWPEWYCDGDPWGYGEDMEVVRDAASRLGIRAQ